MDTPAATVAEVATERVCSNCVNVAFADGGTYCMEFREMVEEHVARRCEWFDPVRPAPPVSVTLRHPARDRELAPVNARSEQSAAGLEGPLRLVVSEPKTTWTDNSGHVHQLQPPPNARSGQTAEVLEANEQLIAACAAHLASLHIASWGQNFSIFDTEGQRQAGEWLAEHIAAVVQRVPLYTQLIEPKGSPPCPSPPSGSGGTAATASSPTTP